MSLADPEIIVSDLSSQIVRDDVSVSLQIFRLETEATWSMEVVNDLGASTVWDELFESDAAALARFWRTVADEGMTAFSDTAKIIPFPR